MKSTKISLALAAAVAALAFTFGGCSGDDGGDEPNTGGGVSSSSDGGGTSSSSGGSGNINATPLEGAWEGASPTRTITFSGDAWEFVYGSDRVKGTWSTNVTVAAPSSGTVTLTLGHVLYQGQWIDAETAGLGSMKTNTASFSLNAAGNTLTISNASITSVVWEHAEGTYTKTSSVVPSSSSGGGTSGVYECDPDGTNPTVTIGSQVWMKCNLNVPHNSGKGESWCYEGSVGISGDITAEEGCARYGRLYDWAAAMNLPSKCNALSGDPIYSNPIYPSYQKYDTDCAITSPIHQGLCPNGFHIPTREEGDALMVAVGGLETAAAKLKAASGWRENSGTDDYGFSALPGGCRAGNGGCGSLDDYGFKSAGYRGYWWFAGEGAIESGLYMEMYYSDDKASWYSGDKPSGFSVRCIKDN
jgi:uncharacterized protein (TIGR02145 family)